MTQPWDSSFHKQGRRMDICECGATKEKRQGSKWVCTSPQHGEKMAALQSQNREQQASQQVSAIKQKALSGVPK
jgi:hypothetical protein